MQRNRPPSAQAVKVLRALAADPARWRYGYDLTAEVHLKSGSLYPILVLLAGRGLLETSWDPGQGSRPPAICTGCPWPDGSAWRRCPPPVPPRPTGPSRAHTVRVRHECPSSFP